MPGQHHIRSDFRDTPHHWNMSRQQHYVILQEKHAAHRGNFVAEEEAESEYPMHAILECLYCGYALDSKSIQQKSKNKPVMVLLKVWSTTGKRLLLERSS